MFRRCVMTVCAEMQSASAICLFVIPFTTQTMISFSRVLNGSGFADRGPVAARRSTAGMKISSSTALCDASSRSHVKMSNSTPFSSFVLPDG